MISKKLTWRIHAAVSLLQGFATLALLAVSCSTAWSQVIPRSRTTDWIPGVTVGLRGGIPQRTNLLDVTRYGATTNNGYVVGTIAAGTSTLTVSSVGDFAVGHGVWISNVFSSVITNIVGNTFRLRDNAPASAAGTIVRHDNSPIINGVIGLAQSNDVVYIPAGKFVMRGGLGTGNKEYISIRGATNSLLVALGSGAIAIGPTQLSPSQGKQFPVPTGVAKGTNQLTLTNIVYTPWNDPIRVGEIYSLSTLNGEDPNFRAISVNGFDRIVSQLIVIEKIQGNVITFSPPVAWNYTNSAHLIQTATHASRGIGLENISITLTNAGESANPYAFTDSILMQQLVDSWVTDCTSSYANNYNIHISGCVHLDIRGNTLSKSLSSGTSHAGLLVEQSTGLLVENNIFDSFDFALQLWGASSVGSAYFANFWTNTTATSIAYHNTHHLMNLFEGNVMDAAFLVDGYYGGNSHGVLLRNRISSTVSFKRFTSYMTVVGNVLGNTTYNYFYDRYSAGSGQWPIFELGNPNIGNGSSTGTSPPMAWNFPQDTFWGNHGDPAFRNRLYTNCSYKFTTTLVNATNIPGNFAHWPYSPYGGYALIFQDPVNTNRYYRLADKLPQMVQNYSTVSAAQPPTALGMVLNAPITISNGWTMYVAGPDTYQQRQSIDDPTHIRHGNYVYTNFIGGTVWDPAITDHTIVTSLLYTNGAPAWWGSRPWPAIGPDLTPVTGVIPAQARYLGIATNNADQIAPSAPASASATAVSTSQVNITWASATDNVAVGGYRIERSTGSGSTSFGEIGAVGGNSFSDSSLSPGTVYNYRIRAFDGAGNFGGYSPTASATTSGQAGDQTAPSTPSTINASAVSPSQISLSWGAATDNVGVFGYRIERSTGAGSSSFVEIASATTTSFNDSGLNSGTIYNYRVRAVDAAGNMGGYSPVGTATTTIQTGGDQTQPSTPSPFTATPASSSQLNLAWGASTDDIGVTGYRLERSIGSGSSSFTQIAIVTGTTYIEGALNSATTYNYRIRAVDAAGNLSSYSAVATATTAAPGGDVSPPSTPSPLIAAVVSSSQISLGWSPATDNVGVTGYRLERSTGSGSTSYSEIGTTAGTSFNNTSLAGGTVYNYRVRAFDAAGNLGGYSPVATATTSPAATPPAQPSAPKVTSPGSLVN